MVLHCLGAYSTTFLSEKAELEVLGTGEVASCSTHTESAGEGLRILPAGELPQGGPACPRCSCSGSGRPQGGVHLCHVSSCNPPSCPKHPQWHSDGIPPAYPCSSFPSDLADCPHCSFFPSYHSACETYKAP